MVSPLHERCRGQTDKKQIKSPRWRGSPSLDRAEHLELQKMGVCSSLSESSSAVKHPKRTKVREDGRTRTGLHGPPVRRERSGLFGSRIICHRL